MQLNVILRSLAHINWRYDQCPDIKIGISLTGLLQSISCVSAFLFHFDYKKRMLLNLHIIIRLVESYTHYSNNKCRTFYAELGYPALNESSNRLI